MDELSLPENQVRQSSGAGTMPFGWSRSAETLLLLLIIGLAVGLRIYRIDVSFQGDEILTLKGASQSFYAVLFHRAYPLYYVLAHFCLYFGESEITLRLPSVAAGVLSVPAIHLLARSVAGRGAGLVAAFLMAINTYDIYYSVCARFYSLVMLAEILLVYTLYKAIAVGGGKSWAFFTLTAMWSVIVQLTVIPFYAAMLVGAGCWIIATRTVPGAKRKVRRIATLGLCAVLGMSTLAVTVAATGAPLLLRVADVDSQNEGDAADEVVDPLGYQYEFSMTPGLYWNYLVSFMPPAPRMVQGILAGFMLAGFIGLCVRTRAMPWIIVTQFVLVPLPFLVTKASHWYNDKYFCSLVPLYVFLIAIGCAYTARFAVKRIIHRRPSHQAEHGRPVQQRHFLLEIAFVSVLAIAYCPFALTAVFNDFTRMEPVDWKDLARYVAEHVEPGDVIVFSREARARTRHRPPEEREYARSHPSFRYYFETYVRKLNPQDSDELLSSLRQVAAGTTDAMKSIQVRYQSHRIWIVSIHENRIDSNVGEYLETLSFAERASYKGGKVRLLKP